MWHAVARRDMIFTVGETRELNMLRVILSALLACPFVGAGFVFGQDKKPEAKKPGAMVMQAQDVGIKGKDDKPDPQLAENRIIAAGQFLGRITGVDEEAGKLKVTVPYRVAKINADVVSQIADLQRQLLAKAVSNDIRDRLQEVPRLQVEIAKARANVIGYDDHELNLDLPLADDVTIRLAQPPPKFDEKGNIARYTAEELAELRGTEKLPGFKGDKDDLRNDVWVRITVVRKMKEDGPRISMAMILGDAAK